MNINKAVDKDYEIKSLKAIADAPVDTLSGITAADAQALKSALGITTVRQLGTNKFFLWAQAIVALADQEG